MAQSVRANAIRRRKSRSPKVSEERPLDLGIVTHVCICGSDTWKILVSFDCYEIATYSTDMYCFNCGAKAIAPTQLDNPEDSDYCEE